jgi:hypothetical protein
MIWRQPGGVGPNGHYISVVPPNEVAELDRVAISSRSERGTPGAPPAAQCGHVRLVLVARTSPARAAAIPSRSRPGRQLPGRLGRRCRRCRPRLPVGRSSPTTASTRPAGAPRRRPVEPDPQIRPIAFRRDRGHRAGRSLAPAGSSSSPATETQVTDSGVTSDAVAVTTSGVDVVPAIGTRAPSTGLAADPDWDGDPVEALRAREYAGSTSSTRSTRPRRPPYAESQPANT